MHATIDGQEIHFRTYGTGDPVLLVHGFPLSSSMWDATVERLGDGWRLIVPDLRGHGASAAAAGTDAAEMSRLVRDLVELLQHLEMGEPCVVVGLSMGGYVAMEMARSAPERVRALVLVDTRAEADSPEAVTVRHRTADRLLQEGTGALADDMAGKLFSPSAPPALREEWRERMASGDPRGYAAALRGMAARRDQTEMLRDWTRPILVVVGEDDEITPPEMARRMHEAAPLSRLVVVPGAGHMVPVEQPDRFADVLRTFLEDLPPLR